MGKEEDAFNWLNNSQTGLAGNEGFHAKDESALAPSEGSGRLYMGDPAYDNDTLKVRLKKRIDSINQPETMPDRNTGYFEKMGKTHSATAGGQGSAIPDFHKNTTYSQDDLIRPFANSMWNKTGNAGNGGEGAPLDPGYTEATFRLQDISEPIVNAWNKRLEQKPGKNR